MTTKPKRKAPATAIDPIFAAIARHKALIKEAGRLEAAASAARSRAEKKYGEWIRAPRPGEWPGEVTVSPFYDRWNRAARAASKAAMRMALTKPTTLAGVAALLDHGRRELVAASDSIEDWLPAAFKTAADAQTDGQHDWGAHDRA
jgi:hypothetical protein